MNVSQIDTQVDLYKILTEENWEASQREEFLVLPAEDAAFIHFAKKDQLERIVSKYWIDVKAYVVLKIDSSQLIGRLVLEANRLGGDLYYHLYEGKIPLGAVMGIEECKAEKSWGGR